MDKINRRCFMVLMVLFFTTSAHSQTDITSLTGGTITYSSSLNNYGGNKAFDDDLDNASKWLADASNLPNVYVTYHFDDGSSYAATSYRLRNQNHLYLGRAPKNFTFLGSTNGTDWDILDTRTDETDWTENESRLYEFSNTQEYSYFKLNISANNGNSSYVGLNEIEIFDEPFGAPETPSNPAPADNSTDNRFKLILDWSSDIISISNYVYITTNATLSESDYIGSTSATSFKLDELTPNTTYRWQVVSSNLNGTTASPVWTFTTADLPDAYVAYDGFNELSNGTLYGQGSIENGWTDLWKGAETANVYVTETPLSYINGEIKIDGGTKAVVISNLNNEISLSRTFDTQKLGDIYFSALLQLNTTNSEVLLSIGLKDNATSYATYRYSAGFNFGYPHLNISAEVYGGSPNRVTTGTDVISGDTYFIVARISRSDTDYQYNKSEILVNPSTKNEPETGWTTVSTVDNTADILNKLTVRSFFMNIGDSYIIDELRIGTTYESVINTYTQPGTIFIIK